MEEGDTLQLTARAVSARGEPVPGAQILWAVVDVDSGQIGFTIDSTTGLVMAFAPGTGRVQARVEHLRSGTIQVTVDPAPDSLAAVGTTGITVDSAAVASPPLTVRLLDLTTSPGEELALAGKAVHFLTVDPQPGGTAAEGFFLTLGDTVPGPDPHHVELATGANGEASITVRRTSGVTQPDSALIEAIALTARGDTVAGSPVQFRLVFQND